MKNTAVIIGVGEIKDRPASPQQALNPAQLMAKAIELADRDAGGRSFAPLIDSMDIVYSVTGSSMDLDALVPELSGCAPRRLVVGPVGGETPVRFLHEAITRVISGESRVSAIVGAEAAHAAAEAAQKGVRLGWEGDGFDWDALLDNSRQQPIAVALGADAPATVYPFYENARIAALGLSPQQAFLQAAALWARYSSVASANPNAWIEKPLDAAAIASPDSGNRMIAWPYRKFMIANPKVNQGAALLVTTRELALEMGVPEDRLIYPVTGASAKEPADYLARDHYTGSSAMEAVLSFCKNVIGAPDLAELYSCFPCVPQMAQETLELAANVAPTVAGGLTFHGAPLNNYMTHAAASMVRALRARKEGSGLLYGQGEFVTKHHALALATAPRADVAWPERHSIQAEADAKRGPVPPFELLASGRARLESFTILYDPAGKRRHGVAILRNGSGARSMARVAADDETTLALLADPDHSPIGRDGSITVAADGIPEWRAGAV